MKKYRKKPVKIEASRWFKHGDHEKVTPYGSTGTCCACENYFEDHGWVYTLEGGHIVCPGDYIIKGVHGECYPCKPDIFQKTYEEVDNSGMSFGQALELLKAGKKVARKGWNGKGMFLWLKPAVEVKSEWCKDPLLKSLADDNGGSIPALGTICMLTHDSTGRKAILTGWLASQSDMLLNDWEEVQ